MDVQVDGCMKFHCFQEVLTDPQLVRHSKFLGLNRNNEKGGLEGATWKLLSIIMGEQA